MSHPGIFWSGNRMDLFMHGMRMQPEKIKRLLSTLTVEKPWRDKKTALNKPFS
jgi:hypothetical protein